MDLLALGSRAGMVLTRALPVSPVRAEGQVGGRQCQHHVRLLQAEPRGNQP